MAVLAVGLRENSRIRQTITGIRLDTKEQLLAIIADRLGALMNAWGGNVDFSIYDRAMGTETKETGADKGQVFSSVEEFIKARYGG